MKNFKTHIIIILISASLTLGIHATESTDGLKAYEFSTTEPSQQALKQVEEAKKHVSKSTKTKTDDSGFWKSSWNGMCRFFNPSQEEITLHLAKNIQDRRILTRLEKILLTTNQDPKTIATTLNTAQSDLIKHQTRLEALKKLKKEVFYGGKKLSEWTQKERKITIDQRKKEEIALIDQPLDSSYAALKAENKWKEEHAKKYDKKKPKPSKTDSAKAREKKAEKRQTESREKYRDNDFISRLKFQATEELLNQLEDGKKPFTVFSGKETIDKLPTIVNEKIKTHIKSQEKLVLSKKQKVDKAELILNGIINELKEKTFKQYAKDQYEDWIKKRDKLLTISGFLFASGVTLHVASSWFKSKRKQLARDLILIQKAKVSEKEKQQMLKERQKAYAKYLPNWMKRFFYGYDLKDEINVLETREEASARDYS